MAMMASSSSLRLLFIISSLLLIITTTSQAQPPSTRPKALVLQVTKDPSTLQYTTTLLQRTPLVPVKLTVDLGADFLWVNCEQNYSSSTSRSPRCGSAPCNLARSKACSSTACGLTPNNPFLRLSTIGDVRQDVLSLRSTDGRNPGPYATVPSFIFTCGSNILLPGLARGVTGIAGFGRTRIALPSQLSSTFSFPRKFAVCLGSGNGVVFFGDGPYVLLPNNDVSAPLTYTPLLNNPVSLITAPLGEPSYEYFIGVKSITVNDKVVPFNTSLLSIDRTNGRGGTKISTVNAYTVLHSEIYKAFTDAFVREAEAMNIKRVAAVAPFGVCFSSKGVLSTRLGAAVPRIDLVLQNKDVVWRIFGANSMVQVRDGVLCLGFVDGGAEAVTSVVIGGYQLEDSLLQFDLAASRLGFSSTLLGRQTTCANFNSTIKA
ncbi:hypothetical protein Syun_029076 [Stephania yunnanensis]|uniref:Peptidase A1 domain-containing protein n=1 Tax=Stephania yunnanensis TaxID=152371 RepID=A0AAP0HJ45_9MAGN